MSKIITLSNLERFHGHLNFSGGSSYIKEIATNDTTGNIYVNTSDGKLYYKSNGTWSAITLYSSKPRAKNLVLRVSNTLKYAGLIDPSDTNASKIRVRIGNTIYAVETSNSAMWNGNASVINGNVEISPKNYIYNSYPIVLGGEDDIEIYVKKKYRDTTKNITDGTPYFSLVRQGKLATSSRDTTNPAICVEEIAVSGNSTYSTTGVIYLFKNTNVYNNGVSTGASSRGNTKLMQAGDIKTEYDYKWKYTASDKKLNFISEAADYDTTSNAVKFMNSGMTYSSSAPEPTHTVYIAMGDMLSSNYGTVIISDFYVKINDVTVLSYSDLINQYS